MDLATSLEVVKAATAGAAATRGYHTITHPVTPDRCTSCPETARPWHRGEISRDRSKRQKKKSHKHKTSIKRDYGISSQSRRFWRTGRRKCIFTLAIQTRDILPKGISEAKKLIRFKRGLDIYTDTEDTGKYRSDR